MKPGLSAQEAQQRLMNNGPNEIPVAKSSGMFRILKEVLREPMFILLLSFDGKRNHLSPLKTSKMGVPVIAPLR